ncbi:MAG: response regulator [Lentisphaeraceae bacterium]|nr:response regulator [Lentisphaeraceae bacterium]
MNEKVLIVDDNETISEVLKDTLEAEGFSVVLCATGTEALEEIENGIYSSAVIDINLPDMNGRDILKSLKKRNHFSQAYILTGAPSMIELSEFIDLGAVDFFTKGELDLKYIVESLKFGAKRQNKWRQVFREFTA